MSDKSKNSSKESTLQDSNKEKQYFKNILICKCGNFHEFYIFFEKEHYIVFPCCSVKLSELNQSEEVSEKCSICKDKISIDRDYFIKAHKNTSFVCESCKKKKEEKEEEEKKEKEEEEEKKEKEKKRKKKNEKVNYTKLSSIDSNDEFRKSIITKFYDFINNNGKINENEFYKKHLEHIKLLLNFISYLCLLKEYYNKKGEIYQIISNFLEYSNHLIDVASNNIQIYDLYHFNKETIIYSYRNNENKTFLSSKFKAQYHLLLEKCKKKRYLSQEMLKYIHGKYKEKSLVDEGKTISMKRDYLKKEKINISQEIFLRASEPRTNYLDIASTLKEIKNELQVIKLKTRVTKLEESLFLDKYLNSYLNIPGKFSIFRKSVSLILDKIIQNNYEKLNFIKPSDKIINLTLEFITQMKKKLLSAENYSKSNLRTKMKILEETLMKYNNRNKKTIKDSINELKIPLIKLDESEKKMIASALENNIYYGNYNNISVENGDDINLDLIINYLFELKGKTSKTIHINEQENLKFYSLSKEIEKLPERNEKDNLKEALEKIEQILEMVFKSEEVTYTELLDFLFNTDKTNFMDIDDKIDYLLSFLSIKEKKLCKIKRKFKKAKNNIKEIKIKLINFMNSGYFKGNIEKYEKFINKYKIKVNSKEIFEYLDNIINYIIPFDLHSEKKKEIKQENNTEEMEDDSEDEYLIKKDYSIGYCEKYLNKEKELRKNINELFEKDPKFITYISDYFWVKTSIYLKDREKNFMENLESIINKFENKYLLFLKLKKLKSILDKLEIYNFDIKKHFSEFISKYEELLPKKRKKIGQNGGTQIGIKDLNTFIIKIKDYLGNANEGVKITAEEPGQFVFNLFLKKIGLTWI